MKNSVYIQQFADDLKIFVDNKASPTKDKRVAEILNNVQLLSEINARLAKEIEFLSDRKITTVIFLKRYKEIEKEFEAKLARIT